MPTFIEINEDKIKEHFKQLKTRHPLTDAQQEVKKKLSTKKNISKLEPNDIFYKHLVEALFPSRIISLFGGYKKLLFLPSSALDFPLTQLTNDFMPKDIDLVVTMDQMLRPTVVLRLINSSINDHKYSYLISCHAQSSNSNVNSHWVTSKNNSCNSFNIGGLVVKTKSIFHLDSPRNVLLSFKNNGESEWLFSCFERVTKGIAISDYGFDVICQFMHKQKMAAATKIQTYIRTKQCLFAYKNKLAEADGEKYNFVDHEDDMSDWEIPNLDPMPRY